MDKVTEITQDIEKIAGFCKALSHPVRAYIAHKLVAMNTCCYSGDIAEELQIGRSALSQHLKELKYAGIIQGETEPPYIKYCINRANWDAYQALYTQLFNNH